MAITKTSFVEKTTVLEDGQIEIQERTQYRDDGFVVTSRSDIRTIDVGDDLTAESDLVKDIVNGNLHNQSRRDARAIVRQEEIERAEEMERGRAGGVPTITGNE